jgi:hypothetical protein
MPTDLPEGVFQLVISYLDAKSRGTMMMVNQRSKKAIESFENWPKMKELLALYMRAKYEIQTLRAHYKTASKVYESLTSEQKAIVNRMPSTYLNSLWDNSTPKKPPSKSDLTTLNEYVGGTTTYSIMLYLEIIEAINSVRDPEIYAAITYDLKKRMAAEND